MGGKRKQTSILTADQAERLAGLPNCSVRQAAEVAVTLDKTTTKETRLTLSTGTDRKKRLKQITNRVAHEARKFKESMVQSLEVDGQVVNITN